MMKMVRVEVVRLTRCSRLAGPGERVPPPARMLLVLVLEVLVVQMGMAWGHGWRVMGTGGAPLGCRRAYRGAGVGMLNMS